MTGRKMARGIQTVALVLACALGASALLKPSTALRNGHSSSSLRNLRLSGGGDAAQSLKEVASRRAEMAKKAQKAVVAQEVQKTSSWSIFRILFAITNKLHITGASTTVVDGKIVMKRNPVQKFFNFGESKNAVSRDDMVLTNVLLYPGYTIIAETLFFFKTMVVPVDQPGTVKNVRTKEDFDDLISSNGNKLIAIDFTASWCGPCQQIGPKFVKMATEFEDCIFVKIDVDENKETAEACDIKAMPTFQFYKGGSLVDSMQGADASGLRSMIERNRKQPMRRR